MKKSSYALIGLLLITMMMAGSIASVRGTTYECTGVVGADATWKVKTVHEGALLDIFDAGWQAVIEDSFGPGAHVQGAKMKSVVTFVNSSWLYDLIVGPGVVDICLILSSVWWWTTEDFADLPDTTNSPTWVFMDPDDITAYCNYYGVNVSYAAVPLFLLAFPYPVDTFLSELVWEADYTISGTTVTHNVVAPYFGAYGIYWEDCTESWRFSKSYGTFLGYKLVHDNGTVAYESELVTPSGEEIPGFELLVLTGTSIGTIICLVYVMMKKRK